MADSDFTFIPPVEPFHNVPGLTPAKDPEDRKRRQRAPSDEQEPAEQDEKDEQDGQKEDSQTSDDGDPHSIDYCA